MSERGAGSDSSLSDDEAPPRLFVRPTSTKRAARAPSPRKQSPRAARSYSPPRSLPRSSQHSSQSSPQHSPRRSPQHNKYVPPLLEGAAIIHPPPGWVPAEAVAQPSPSGGNTPSTTGLQRQTIEDASLSSPRPRARLLRPRSPKASRNNPLPERSGTPQTTLGEHAEGSVSPRRPIVAYAQPPVHEQTPVRGEPRRREDTSHEGTSHEGESREAEPKEVPGRGTSQSLHSTPSVPGQRSSALAQRSPGLVLRLQSSTQRLQAATQRSPAAMQRSAAAQRSPRRLRFASPPAAPPSPPSPATHKGYRRASPAPDVLRSPASLSARPIPVLAAADTLVPGTPKRPSGRAESPRLAKVPKLSPEQSALLGVSDAGSSSPYGAQRSPVKSAALSPERPLTMQMHYLLARESGGADEGGEDGTLANELALFGELLDARLAPRQGAAVRADATLEAAEMPVLWKAVEDLHARGRRLLEEVLEERERRVVLEDLPGGYARFSILERQGIEAAIVDRQKERCLTLRARATEVQQLYIELRDQVWTLERQKAEADLLEAQIGASASHLADVEVLEAEVAAEEAAVGALEAEVESAEADWRASRAEVTALIAENKAGLEQVSAWVLDGQPPEREREVEQAAAQSRQRFDALLRELKLSINLGASSGDRVYAAAEHLGFDIDLQTGAVEFSLRHRGGAPILSHFLRLVQASTEPLRERIQLWHEGLAAQRAVQALEQFGPSTVTTENGALVYKQRLYRPSGELAVRFEGRRQYVEGELSGVRLESVIARSEDLDDDTKPQRLTLGAVVQRIQQEVPLL